LQLFRTDQNRFMPADVAVKAEGLGVKYLLGSCREDIQSMIFNTMLNRHPKKYLWALHEVTVSLFKGDIIGVIGSNGAGKSTFCKVISGLLRPDAGHIDVVGDVTTLLSVGAGFKNELSGLENIFLYGMMLGLSRGYLKELLIEIIGFSGLDKFIDQPLKNYSSGMRSRLAFSIAAMVEPDILVMDEALSTGDLEFSERAGRKLQNLITKSGMAFIVTHNLNFVANFCNRALWIEKGNIKADGLPEEVLPLYEKSASALSSGKRILCLKQTAADFKARKVISAENLGVKFHLLEARFNKSGKSRPGDGCVMKKKEVLWALRGVDFTVSEGEILGIIGPNAAGKTTLCRVLCGILKPDAGTINIDGDTTALLSFGSGFNIQLAGRDNVYLNGMMLGIDKKRIDHLYDEVVEFSGLAKFMDQPVKNYSSGMRARLGFSIMSIIKPDIFIIDEALNAGDIHFYEKASRKVQELMAEAKATIVVTHNIHFVDKVCTRALWMDKGRILFDGDPKEAVTRYRDFVKNKI